MNNLKEIILKIKTKKWKNLDESVIKDKINLYLKKNPKIKIEYVDEKNPEFKKIVKFVKQEMHRSYGAFQSNTNKRDKLLEELIKETNETKKSELKEEILKTHSSTRERLSSYAKLKQKMSFLRGKTILDLGCGLNPLMFDNNKIIAVEFNKDDVDFLNKYFDIINKNRKETERSKAIVLDLTKKENIVKLNKEKFDVVFAWKLFDLLNSDVIEAIVKLDYRIIAVSFSTKTLGNKQMNVPKRKWFETKLDELNLKSEAYFFENELFYVIEH